MRAAIAPSTTSAADIGKSSVWCSPMPKKSTPTWLGQHALFDEVADRLGVRQRAAVIVVR